MRHYFEAIDENNLRLGESEFALRLHYGIDTRAFMGMFHRLADDYSFRISKIEFKVDIPCPNKVTRKGIIRVYREYIDFIIYCNLLEQRGIRIANLVRNCTQGDYHEVMHARALAILAYLYSKQGFDVEFFSRIGCDFAVNGIKSELKCRIPEVLSTSHAKRQPRIRKIRNESTWDASSDLMLDLMNRLSGLVRAVRQQADLVFFDCSSIATLGLAFLSDQLNRFVEPKKWRVIFYQTRFLPHGREMYWKDNRGMKSIGTPLYPDLHSFSGSYIDFDPLLWGFFTTHL